MLKKLLLILTGTFVVLAAALLVAPSFIKSESFRQTIIEQVHKKTGRTLVIGGDMQIRLFPSVGVAMKDVTLSNPPGYPNTHPLLRVKSFNANVALLPLLSKAIEIKSLTLEEPQIYLYVSSDGIENWDMANPQSPMKEAPQKDGKAAPSAPSGLMLGDVDIKDGTVIYQSDYHPKSRWEARKLDLHVEMGGIASSSSIRGSGEWNGQNVDLKVKLGSLARFMAGESTDIDAGFSSELLKTTLTGEMGEKHRFKGKASIKSPSLKAALAWIDPAAKPVTLPAALALDISSDAECSEKECSFTNASLMLDEIKAQGKAKIAFKEVVPSIEANLVTGMLNLNPYLMPSAHASVSGGWLVADANAQSSQWSDQPINYAVLQALNLNLTLQPEGIVFRNITIGNAPFTAQLQRGRLDVTVPEADMYGGKGGIILTVDSNTQMLQGQTDFSDINVESFLNDALGIDQLSGIADLRLDFLSRGKSERELVSLLAGNGSLKMKDGVIKGVNLQEMLRNVGAAFKNTGGNAKTEIKNASANISMTQGVISNDDLLADMGNVRVTGKGQVSLPAYTVNYRLAPQTVLAAQTPEEKAKEGLAVPVLITGSIDRPMFQPDVGSVVQDALNDPKKFKEQLKNTRGSLKEQIKEPKEMIKNLKGLFGQ